MVSVMVKLGRLDEGEKLYRSLLFMNPDNYRYFIFSSYESFFRIL